METIAERVQKWDLSSVPPVTSNTTYGEIHKRISYYHSTHYHQYLPTLSVRYPDFELRLARWLDNLPGEDEQRLLFEMLPQIAFFSREDFVKLHQSAYEGPVLRWILEVSGLSLSDANLNEKLSTEAERNTWYCPLSDSLRINDFHNVNELGGVDNRPDWRSLAKFSNHKKIFEYMSNHLDCSGLPTPLKRVVIIEDFIGSGAQGSDTVKFIKDFSATVPVLVVALIACPAGATMWRTIESPPNLVFKPVIELKSSDMITASRAGEPSFEGNIAKLASDTFHLVTGDGAEFPRPYSPFGFPDPDGTGAMVSLYANTPANTLPLIQHTSSTWHAIFPRSARIR